MERAQSNGSFGKPGLDGLVNDRSDDELDLSANAFRIGLLIPMCGSAGIWGPSCIANAQLAVNELNQKNGIMGREVQLIIIDSAIEAETPIESMINSLIEEGSIDAIVGMHISAIRQRLTKIVKGRIPYVYTPLYEGGEHSEGVFTIGDTPAQQLAPAMEYMDKVRQVKKWALIGNDYVWPHTSNAFAKDKIKQMQGELTYERYVQFGQSNFEHLIDDIIESKADIILMTLVGQDAVDFNRAFGERYLDDKICRLSCAIDENGLLASGEKNLKNLFVTSSYFGALNTKENRSFKERYYTMHSERAPILNALGVSIYDGVQFLSTLLDYYPKNWKACPKELQKPMAYNSVRGAQYRSNRASGASIYLARADGHCFEIIEKLNNSN